MTAAQVRTAARLLLVLLSCAGLAVDAYVHLSLASTYDAIKTSTLSQGDLFRAEGVAAMLAAAVMLIRPRRYSALVAFAVAASGFAAIMIYRYLDVGPIGPLPSMYEPIWYPKKTLAAFAEGIATAAAFAYLVMTTLGQRRDLADVPAIATSAGRSD